MSITDPTAEEAQEPQGPEEQDPMAGLDESKQLVDDLGNAATQNAKKAAMADSAEDAKNYAQAALYATEALTALLAYVNPESPNAPGDNPAKKGD